MARSPAKGSILQYSLDSTNGDDGIWVNAAILTQVETPGSESQEIDGTALEDTAKVAFLDIPEFTTAAFRGYADSTDPDQYDALLTFKKDVTLLWWRIVWPISEAGNTTNSQDAWQGRVQSIQRTASFGGMIEFTFSVRATGELLHTLEAA